MGWLDHIKLSYVKAAAYVTGALYILASAAYLCASILWLGGDTEREKQIGISVKSISVIPAIPFYFGVIFDELPLCLPIVVGIVYGLCADMLYLMFVMSGIPLKSGRDDIFSIIVFTSLGVTVIFALVLTATMIKLHQESKDVDSVEEVAGAYALKRFDAMPVSYEMESVYLKLAEQDTTVQDTAKKGRVMSTI